MCNARAKRRKCFSHLRHVLTLQMVVTPQGHDTDSPDGSVIQAGSPHPGPASCSPRQGGHLQRPGMQLSAVTHVIVLEER